LLSLLATSVVFTSCSKDDDEFSHPIIGEWHDKQYPDETKVFRSDKTSTWVSESDGVNNVSIKNVIELSYSINDEKKIITINVIKFTEDGKEKELTSVDKKPFTQGFVIKGGELTFSDSDGVFIRKK